MSAVRDVTVHAEGLSFLESPRWYDGRLWVSDFFGQRVLSLTDGELEVVCTPPGSPSGLGFDPEGRLLIVSMGYRRLLRWENETFSEVADFSEHAPGLANDMVVDVHSRAYIGNFGFDGDPRAPIRATNLIRVDPGGTVSIAARDVVFPNGTVLTPDGSTLLLAETFAHRITAFDVLEDGSLDNRRVWALLGSGEAGGTIEETVASGRPLPDGMALDSEGAVWIGDAGGDGALRIAEGGEILDRVPTGELAVYATALGGDDRATLFMCAAPPLLQHDPRTERRSSLLSCCVEVPGVGRP